MNAIKQRYSRILMHILTLSVDTRHCRPNLAIAQQTPVFILQPSLSRNWPCFRVHCEPLNSS